MINTAREPLKVFLRPRPSLWEKIMRVKHRRIHYFTQFRSFNLTIPKQINGGFSVITL